MPIKKKFCGEGTRRLFHYDTPEKTDENLLKEFHKNSPTKHESKPNILNTHTKIGAFFKYFCFKGVKTSL